LDKAEIVFEVTTYLPHVPMEGKENTGLATSCFFGGCATQVQFWRLGPAVLTGQKCVLYKLNTMELGSWTGWK